MYVGVDLNVCGRVVIDVSCVWVCREWFECVGAS